MTSVSFKKQWIRALALLALVLFCDQLTKYLIDTYLPIREYELAHGGRTYFQYEYVPTSRLIRDPGPIQIIPNFFYIVHVVNKGAAWGIFHGRMNMLTMISLGAFLVMAIWFRRFCGPYGERGIGMGLLMGGTLGNLVDRMNLIPRQNGIHGVIDFISMQYKLRGWEYPSFNIADSAICVGVFILCVSSLLRPDEQGKRSWLGDWVAARWGEKAARV